MKRIWCLGIAMASITLVACICVCCLIYVFPISFGGEDETPYSNPPLTLQESDLAGTWEVRYGWGSPFPGEWEGWGDDTLIIRADGTFKQIFKHARENYVYETPWNNWTFERFSDGRIRLHLQGARYYKVGVEFAELEGWNYRGCSKNNPSCVGGGSRYRVLNLDPLIQESEPMIGKLILNVQENALGELVLLHLLYGGDGSFIITFPYERAIGFHRTEEQ